MLSIRTLLSEQELADAWIHSLSQHRIEEKFFYWFPLSVRAWLDLCSDSEYRNYIRSRSLISQQAPDIAPVVGEVEVISLGSGQGDKDALLLEALASKGEVSYRPVDASLSLLELALAEAGALGIPAEGVKADFTDIDHLRQISAIAGSPKLWMMIGNTLGSMDPRTGAKMISSVMQPGDWALLDGELHGDETTLKGYDNPINRRFAWGPLNSIGITEADGEIAFAIGQEPDDEGLFKLSKSFTASRDLDVVMSAEAMHLPKGTIVQMSHSYKYGQGRLDDIAAQAGLQIERKTESEDGRFTMILARKG